MSTIRKMTKRRLVPLPIICVAALCSMLTPSFAHQEWVMPNFFVNDTEDDSVWLAFEHALGDQRFNPSLGPGPALMSITGPNNEQMAPSFVYTGKTQTVGEIELETPGTYQIATTVPESYWTKIVENGETRWVRGSRDRVTGKQIEVSRRYWTRSMTYVTFRSQTRGPLAAQGDPLEIVPIDHPNAIVTGEPFRIEVHANGAPLSGGEIKVFGDATEGHDAEMEVSTGADGRAQLKFPHAGRYLISIYHQVAAENDPRADSYGYSVNLMIEARAGR